MRTALVLALIAAASIGLPAPLGAHRIAGTAEAIDGDTLAMTGARVRLAHIDAPETRQGCETKGELWACGQQAGAALASLVAGEEVVCRSIARDVYGREVAVCQTRTLDLGEEMVRRGLAIASEDAPEHYRAMEGLAKRQRSGIWASDFRLPAEWRAANLPQQAPPAEAPGPVADRVAQAAPQIAAPRQRVYRNGRGCTIKGNRNWKGEWIYHLPGRPYYAQTRAEEMFCTEAEARAAGYRRSRA